MDDNASIADSSMSAVTSKSKCGATNKHCTVEGCSVKKAITGNHWARHVKGHTDKGMAKESVCFVACIGQDCDLCPQGKLYSLLTYPLDLPIGLIPTHLVPTHLGPPHLGPTHLGPTQSIHIANPCYR